MPIDINNINSNSQTKRAGDHKHVKIIHSDSSASTQASNSTAQDSVNLTDSALRMKTLEDKINRLPIIDTQKVEQIRNSINDGSFEFNSVRIAEKMLNFEKELF